MLRLLLTSTPASTTSIGNCCFLLLEDGGQPVESIFRLLNGLLGSCDLVFIEKVFLLVQQPVCQETVGSDSIHGVEQFSVFYGFD